MVSRPTFPNFKVDRLVLWSSEMPMDGFWGPEIVQSLVGMHRARSTFQDMCQLINLYNRERIPTGAFATLDPQDQEIVEIYVVQNRRATDF